MALQGINIDDRNFDQLLEELKKHIPLSQWTDHNPSDPGIMLLELFAWLGEMTLYRMNQVPKSHREKFLKLIIDPPEPVTVDITLEAIISKERKEDLVIPAGTRFATEFKKDKRYTFETYREYKIPKLRQDEIDGTKKSIIVNARSYKEIKDEILGKSDGTPNQTFTLKEAPVLLDFVYNTPIYDPNPVVYVDREKWELKQFLMVEKSQGNYFMVDEFENQIRFGDGQFGAIPPGNSTIKCSYQVLQGPEALITAGELKHILDNIPGIISPLESIIISGNKDAQGGNNFVQKEERFQKGLQNFREPYRLVTAEDFEHAILSDFNELQDLTRNNEFNEFASLPPSLYKIFRVSVLMNRQLSGTFQPVEKNGHVTLLVIPEFNKEDLQNKTFIEVNKTLEDKIINFLDKRRLITTQIHIMPAKLKKIDITIDVVIYKDRNYDVMKESITKKINDFMDILTGGFDGKGWPAGKDVYKSHLYRLVEDCDGVDHVKSLTLSPSDENCIKIGENELPLLCKLSISLERS